jgi:hypothetical protein
MAAVFGSAGGKRGLGVPGARRSLEHPTPFGSKNWQYASLEALQRLVAMTAIQFILFEPVGRVRGNDEFKVAADRMIGVIIAQLKTLKTKKSDW